MSKPKDIGSLLSCLTDGVAEYSYECKDKDFEIVVRVYAESGWCGVDEVKERKEMKNEQQL